MTCDLPLPFMSCDPDLRDGFSTGSTLSASRPGSAQGLQMVLFTELESSKVVANVLEARSPLYPLQTVGQK